MTVGWSLVADRYGRRRTAVTMAALMLLGGPLLAARQGFSNLLAATLTAFPLYNLVTSVALAVGSLFAASVAVLQALGLTGADAYRPLFVLYAVVGVAQIALFAWLSDRAESAKVEGGRRFIGVHRSAGTVAKLSALFGLDAFAGGLIANSLVAYWFVLRWGFEVGQLSAVIFA